MHWPRKPHFRNTYYWLQDQLRLRGWELYIPFLYLLTGLLTALVPCGICRLPCLYFQPLLQKPTSSLCVSTLLKTKKLLIPVQSPSEELGRILGIKSSYRPLANPRPDSPWPGCPPLTRSRRKYDLPLLAGDHKGGSSIIDHCINTTASLTRDNQPLTEEVLVTGRLK